MSKYKGKEEHEVLFRISKHRNAQVREFDSFRENQNPAPFPAIMQLRMHKDSGIFFGKGNYYRYIKGDDFSHSYIGKPLSMDGHAIAIGSSGSGKGECIAKPTLLACDCPKVILDPKGDLYNFWLHTPGLAKRPTKVFNPSMDGNSTYDPFAMIRADDESNLYVNVSALVNSIIPLPDGVDEFWGLAPRKLLTAAFLHYISIGSDFNTAVIRIMSLPLDALIKMISTSESVVAKMLVRSHAGPAEKSSLSKSNMIHSITELLDIRLMDFVSDGNIQNALSPSDNEICWERDINTHDIFLTIPREKIDRWGSTLNMMIAQLIHVLGQRPEKYSAEGKYVKPVLIVLDEFPEIGRMDVLAKALSVLRSKNVTFLLFAQNLNQLRSIYGETAANTMIGNCDFRAVLRSNDLDSQRYFSELAGTTPTLLRSSSRNVDSEGNYSYSQGLHESHEPVIRTQELGRLDRELILYTPYGDYRVPKAPYHKWKPETFGTQEQHENMEAPHGKYQ